MQHDRDDKNHDADNPGNSCLHHISYCGSLFLAELLSHGGQVIGADGESVTYEVAGRRVKIRGDIANQRIDVKEIGQ